MSRLYQKFLFGAGKAYKSKNKLAHGYGRWVVWLLSTVFHRKHYRYEDIVKEVDIFCPDVSEAEKKTIIKKVKKAYFKYRCKAKEYFIYDLEHKSKQEIKEYLFDIEKTVLVYLINSRKDLALLHNKQHCYEKLKPYYHRDVIYMEKKGDLSFEEFESFVRKHHTFVTKVSNSSCGRGIDVYQLKEEELTGEKLQAIYQSIQNNVPVVIEEYLHNEKSIDAYYDKALNIMRIVVFKTKEGPIQISNCYYTFGRGEQKITNNLIGSIAVMLDPKTGESISNGFTFASFVKEYETHPDSGLVFRELKINRWEEMLALVQELSDALPQLKYVGWDLTLTPNGWCIVEGNGNGGQIIYQVVAGRSIREDFLKYYYLT